VALGLQTVTEELTTVTGKGKMASTVSRQSPQLHYDTEVQMPMLRWGYIMQVYSGWWQAFCCLCRQATYM